MYRRDKPRSNLEPHCSNELDDYLEVGNLLEELEEQDHNMWTEGPSVSLRSSITGLLIQACLSDEELGSSGNQLPLRSGLFVWPSCMNSVTVQQGAGE